MKKPDSLKIFIAEDSQQNIDTLQILLQDTGQDLEVLQIAKDLKSAEQALREQTYDLAFLDIQFKEGTIFEVLERLSKEEINLPDVVFVTAHGSYEYATQAIKYACLDFINKPIQPNQLQKVVEQSRAKGHQANQQRQLKLLIELLERDVRSPQKIAVVMPKNAIEYIDMDDLLYILADGSTSIFFLRQKSFHSTRPLGYYIELFEDHPSILQINRSCILHQSHIAKYHPSNRTIVLSNGTELQVSVRMNKQVGAAIKGQGSNSFLSILDRVKRLLS